MVKKLLSKNITKHLLFWIVLTIYASIIDPIEGTLKGRILATFLIMVRYAFFYYLEVIIILPKFYKRKMILSVSIFLTYLCFFMFFQLTYKCFISKDIIKSMFEGEPIHSVILSNVIMFGLISTMAFGAYQNKQGISNIKLKIEKEKALLTKEMGFLKNQFNSHITFNFFNYCYSRIYKNSMETAEAIDVFARMLRYSLNNKVHEMVPLAKEIEYIEDFITLQKLLSNSVKVKFFVLRDESNSIYILPGILITIVENAFKHGDLYSIDQPITIQLYSSSTYLEFTVTNKKNNHVLTEVSGIGHSNLKQQLEIQYKNKYVLKLEDNETSYSSNLKLMLNH